jgi:hypothetical protein
MTLAATAAAPPPVPQPTPDVALRSVPTAPSVPSASAVRSVRSARVQGAVVIGALVAAVVGTVALVVTPVPPSGGSSSAANAGRPGEVAAAVALPAGLRVDVRGGQPLVAYGVADRLTGAGASLGAVLPASADDTAPETTTIVYYDRASMAVADRIRSMLGRGTLRRQQVFQPVVDVTIVLGKDLSRL